MSTPSGLNTPKPSGGIYVDDLLVTAIAPHLTNNQLIPLWHPCRRPSGDCDVNVTLTDVAGGDQIKITNSLWAKRKFIEKNRTLPCNKG